MQNSEEIKIPLNKSRIFQQVLGSLVFVAGGLWFIVNPLRFGNPVWIVSLGVVTVIFFGYAGSTILLKLFDRNPALIISENGILNNSNGFSKQFVTWPEIIGFDISTVSNQSFLNVFVKNPREYIKNERNPIKKMLLKMNLKYYNTVVAIPLKTLDYNREKLLQLLIDRHKEYISKVEPNL